MAGAFPYPFPYGFPPPPGGAGLSHGGGGGEPNYGGGPIRGDAISFGGGFNGPVNGSLPPLPPPSDPPPPMMSGPMEVDNRLGKRTHNQISDLGGKGYSPRYDAQGKGGFDYGGKGANNVGEPRGKGYDGGYDNGYHGNLERISPRGKGYDGGFDYGGKGANNLNESRGKGYDGGFDNGYHAGFVSPRGKGYDGGLEGKGYREDFRRPNSRQPRPYHYIQCVACGDEFQRHYWKTCGVCGTSLTNQAQVDRMQQEAYDATGPSDAPLLDPATEAQYAEYINFNRPPLWLLAAIQNVESDAAKMLFSLKARPPWFDKFASNKFVKLPQELVQHFVSLPHLHDKNNARKDQTRADGNGAFQAPNPFVSSAPDGAVPLDARIPLRGSALNADNPFGLRRGNLSPAFDAAADKGWKKTFGELQVNAESVLYINDKDEAHDQDMVQFIKVDPNDFSKYVVKVLDVGINISVSISSLAAPTIQQVLRYVACEKPIDLVNAINFAYSPNDVHINPQLAKEDYFSEVTNLLNENAKQSAEISEMVGSLEALKYQMLQQHAILFHKRYSAITVQEDSPSALSALAVLEAVPQMRIGANAKTMLVNALKVELEDSVPYVTVMSDPYVHASCESKATPPSAPQPVQAAAAPQPAIVEKINVDSDTDSDLLSDVVEYGDMCPEDRNKLEKATDGVRSAEKALRDAEQRLQELGGEPSSVPDSSVPKGASSSPPRRGSSRKKPNSDTPEAKIARLAVGSPAYLGPSPAPAEAAQALKTSAISRRRR